MKILYGTTSLASGGMESPFGLQIAGQQVNDELAFFGAAVITLRSRGGRSVPIGFSVTRSFASVRAASRFAATHFAALPEQATLYQYIGTDDDGEWLRWDSAVIDSAVCVQRGVTITTTYRFRAAAVTTESTAPDTPEIDTAMKASTTDIPADATEVAVTFATPFATAAKITGLTVQVPAGGDNLWAMIKGAPTATGFTALLSAPCPGADYKLVWSAIAS